MKAAWRRGSARFDALKLRERALLLLAALALVVYAIHQFGVAPQRARAAAAARLAAQAQTELAQIEGQIQLITAESRDPDAPLRARIAELRGRIEAADARLAGFEASLVPPQRVPALLQDLLARRSGLRLMALRTLPAAPLAEPAGAKPPAAKEAEPAAGLAVYRHAVEITVEGGYADLAAYLAELEGLRQRLYWSSASLRVAEHPVIVLKVTVHTLSLERTWLRV